jgi:glycosyltransferase involved in cell wall biosynthesis
MAMKRLIISSDLPVLREILNTGNAMLCACNSVVEWHTTIQKSIDNPDLRLSLADKARSDAGQYTWYNRVLACLSVF